jgi:hypothetical protein
VLMGPGCKSSLLSPQSNSQAITNKNADPEEIQGTIMSFATRYVTAMTDVFDRVQKESKSPQTQSAAQQGKILAGIGALSNAVNPNPIVGLMDMGIMVTLTRETLEDPWALQAYGPECQAMIVETIKTQETDIWTSIGYYLTPDQIAELHGLAERWRKEHPQQRFVGGAHLADYQKSARPGNGNGLNLAHSVLGLVQLDPFSGLDPAVRQVEESRILGERMFFYLQNMATVLSWQVDQLYYEMLAEPQVVQLFKDTSGFTTNTTHFAEATSRFADASMDLAKTVEKFRADLPEQQATLVKQLNDVVATQRAAALTQVDTDLSATLDTRLKQVNDIVATQRDEALKQATTQIAAQRDAAITQLDAAVTTQQDQMAKNLQGVMDSSIDRLYGRVLAIVLVAAGALLGVLVMYRIIAKRFFDGKSRA